MNLANLLTTFRILLVPGLIISIVYYHPSMDFLRLVALGIFFIGCLTDAIDGYVARAFNQKTELGTLLDPLADKLILLSSFLCIFFQPHFALKPPVWIIILIASRDFMIILGLIILYVTTGKIHPRPNILGKMTTFFQMLTVIFLLLQHSLVLYLWNIAAILTLASGVVYLIREGRALRENAIS